MTTASRRRARLARVCGLLAGAAVLAAMSGCGAGQITQTAAQVAVVPGVNASAGTAGQIALRDLAFAFNGPQGYPQGGSAPLVTRIFNDGPTTVKLVKVTSEDAASVILIGGPAAATPTPTPAATASSSATPSAGPSATSSATPGPPTPAPPAGQSTFAIEIPAAAYTLLVPGQGPYLQLTGLKRALTAGLGASVTFTFDDGSSVTVNVPVTPPLTPLPRVSPAVEMHESE